MESNYFFMTQAGLKVYYIPPSATVLMKSDKGIEAAFRKRGEPVDKPTYKVELAGSTPERPLFQTFEYDEKYCEGIPERQAKWDAWLDAVLRMNREKNRIQREIAFEAMLIQLPEDDTWEKLQQAKYIEVPPEPQAKRQHYIETEILRTTADAISALAEIIASAYSGTVPEESIQAAKDTFRYWLYADQAQESNPAPAIESTG